MSTRTVAARPVENEARVLERARAGEEAALETLVRAHQEAVYRVAYRVLGDPDRAADATQDTFLRALRALDGFRSESSVRTWLLRIATNTALSAGRRETRRREVGLETHREHIGSGGSDPERQALGRLEAERVEAAIRSLPEKQRLAVSLRIHDGLSHREIGQVLGSSEGAARVNYHLGIKRLRELLA